VDPALINIATVLGLLVLTYFTGTWAVTFRRVPSSWEVLDSGLVAGNVVISVDYFKRFLAGLRGLVGGRIKSYESLLDRARREAILRLKKDAMDHGYHAVVNVRLETSRMANARGKEGTAGLEILAFGTGLKLRQPPA
jgi:uncharacterized protein YbjQ (UPF0145 family)